MIRPFFIMLLYWYLLHYGLLLHIMSQYLCLFSLILQGLHKEGECRQLEFWLKKEQTLETYSAQLQKSWNSTKPLFGFIKNLWEKYIGQGAHTLSRRQGRPPYSARPLSPGPPGGLPATIFCYMKGFVLEKFVGKLTGRNSPPRGGTLAESI